MFRNLRRMQFSCFRVGPLWIQLRLEDWAMNMHPGNMPRKYKIRFLGSACLRDYKAAEFRYSSLTVVNGENGDDGNRAALSPL